MTEGKDSKTPPNPLRSQEKSQRLKVALRANLTRRKAQAKARAAQIALARTAERAPGGGAEKDKG